MYCKDEDIMGWYQGLVCVDAMHRFQNSWTKKNCSWWNQL